MSDYDENVYYSPEKSGLRVVGELEGSSGSYEYNTFVVWADDEGDLYYESDYGCSCPTPFEGFSRDTLNKVPFEKSDRVEKAINSWRDELYGDYLKSVDVTELMRKIRQVRPTSTKTSDEQ